MQTSLDLCQWQLSHCFSNQVPLVLSGGAAIARWLPGFNQEHLMTAHLVITYVMSAEIIGTAPWIDSAFSRLEIQLDDFLFTTIYRNKLAFPYILPLAVALLVKRGSFLKRSVQLIWTLEGCDPIITPLISKRESLTFSRQHQHCFMYKAIDPLTW